MRIAIINHLRLPTEKAHGYQLAKTAEALADLGHQVIIIHPSRQNPITEDFFTFYRVRTNFELRTVPAVDWLASGLPSRLGFYLSRLQFMLKALWLSLSSETIILTRAPELAWLFGRRGYRVYYDVHNWPRRFSPTLKLLLRPAAGAVANSPGTAAAAGRYGLRRVLVAPNGVDLNDFIDRESEVTVIRQKYELEGKTIIAYAGHFYNWKGVDILIRAMSLLPADKFACLLVGAGPNSNQGNVLTVGRIPHHEVPAYLLAADILVLPTAPISAEAERYTSPIKLFEYLAAGKAIVVSDLPSSRVVVSAAEAEFFPAGDAAALAATIEKLATDPVRRQILAAAAAKLAVQYTWAKRAGTIADFLVKS